MTILADYIMQSSEPLNPLNPAASDYMGHGNLVGMILRPADGEQPTLVVTGYNKGEGFGYDEWLLGTEVECEDLYREEHLGFFIVVGRINFATGESEGIVPDAELIHAVFK